MTGIQIALDLTPKELAKALGMARAELVDRHGPRAAMSNWVVDPLWEILLRYVNDRLAGFMVVKEALERKQRVDQREHHARQQQVRERR